MQALKGRDSKASRDIGGARGVHRTELRLLPLLSLILALVLPASTSRSHLEKPFISKLIPASGPIGTAVTIQGRGFTDDNTIEFRSDQGSFEVDNVRADDGSLKFQVNTCPSYQPQCPARYVAPAPYIVTVRNAGGRSNEAKFTLTSRSVVSPAMIQ